MTEPRPCATCRYRLTFSCPCQRPKCRLDRPEHASGQGCPQWAAKPAEPAHG
jgi:hypothetical protein